MKQRDQQRLSELRGSTLAVLADVIPRGSDVVVLDAPNQRNVGDSMIWMGELAYFRQLDLSVRLIADIAAYDPDAVRRALPDGGTILIHGGGNVGDLWRGHQRHREQVSRDFRDLPIVQLPQSVWFDAPKRAANANRILGAHPDFTLLLRETKSLARAESELPDVPRRLCWDMALGWDPVQSRRARAAEPALLLARTDREGGRSWAEPEFQAGLGVGARVADWTSEVMDSPMWRAARAVPSYLDRHPQLRRTRPGRAALSAAIRRINSANVASGVALFADRRIAVVDRLHAHVLAVLLGIDHVLLDNSYGKLSAVYDDCTGEFSTAHFASTPDEALEIGRALLAGSRG